MLRRLAAVTAAVVALGVVLNAPSAMAQNATLKVGTLVCKAKGGIGLILGSKELLNCTYESAGGSQREYYTGTITKIGLDIGIKGESTIVWAVLYSTSALPPHGLAGDYGGVSADVAVGYGAGANVLLGGSNKSVALQPLSVEGEIGLDVAVGISGLTLRPVRG